MTIWYCVTVCFGLLWEILSLTLSAYNSSVSFPLPSTETKVAFILWVPLILFLRQSLMYWGLPTGSQETTSLWFQVSWIMHVVKQLKLIKINIVSGYRIQVLKPSRETLYPELYYQPQTIFQRADFEDQIFYFLINLFFVLEIQFVGSLAHWCTAGRFWFLGCKIYQTFLCNFVILMSNI